MAQQKLRSRVQIMEKAPEGTPEGAARQLERQPSKERIKSRLSRRPNSCQPCRRSKLKCDGRRPSCTTCEKKVRNASSCVYFPQGRATSLWRQAQSKDISTKGSPHHPPQQLVEGKRYWEARSITPSVQQSMSLGVGHQLAGVVPARPYNDIGAFEATPLNSIDEAVPDGQVKRTESVPVSTSMAPETPSPTLHQQLRKVYEETVRVHQLVHMAKLVEAWTTMPQLIRLAQLENCCDIVDNKTPPNTPTSEGSAFRSRLLRSILALDPRLGSCPEKLCSDYASLGIKQPTLEGLEGPYKVLEQSKFEFHRYALEVLSEICLEDDQTRFQSSKSLKLDQLLEIEQRFSNIAKDQTDDKKLVVALGDHAIELFSLKNLLSCTLAQSHPKSKGSDFTPTVSDDGLLGEIAASPSGSAGPGKAQRGEAYTYQSTILESARSVLTAYKSIAQVESADERPNFNRLYDTYCAVAILARATLRGETTISSDLSLIGAINRLFQDRASSGDSSTIIAATWIGELWNKIQKALKSWPQGGPIRSSFSTPTSWMSRSPEKRSSERKAPSNLSSTLAPDNRDSLCTNPTSAPPASTWTAASFDFDPQFSQQDTSLVVPRASQGMGISTTPYPGSFSSTSSSSTAYRVQSLGENMPPNPFYQNNYQPGIYHSRSQVQPSIVNGSFTSADPTMMFGDWTGFDPYFEQSPVEKLEPGLPTAWESTRTNPHALVTTTTGMMPGYGARSVEELGPATADANVLSSRDGMQYHQPTLPSSTPAYYMGAYNPQPFYC